MGEKPTQNWWPAKKVLLSPAWVDRGSGYRDGSRRSETTRVSRSREDVAMQLFRLLQAHELMTMRSECLR